LSERTPDKAESAAATGRQELRIFVSSPGDVTDERQLVHQVVVDLVAEPLHRDRVMLTLVSWDDPATPLPLLADRTPQQSINRHARPSDCDIVVFIFWSRIGTALPDECRKTDGTKYLSGTEWEFEDAINARPTPDILVYRRNERPAIDLGDPQIAEKREQWGLLEKFFAGFRNPDGSRRHAVAEYNTPSTFADLLKKNLRELIEARLGKPSSAPSRGAIVSAETVVVQPWTLPPYPGLRPFTGEEAALFFGRGQEVDALIALLRDPTRGFLAVVGASGSGKSSLVHAGLLPRLANGAIEGSRDWLLLPSFTPGAHGDDPFLALASELKSKLPARERKPQVEIAKELAEAPHRISAYANTLLVGPPARAAIVVFIDQLEELFTLVDEARRGAFLKLLVHAAKDPRLRILTTLRVDFLSNCAAEPAIEALRQAGTFMLGPPGPAALVDMIRRPAERTGLDFEDGLADTILKDAAPEPGEALPLVAFCLQQLYRRAGHALNVKAYHELGGLQGLVDEVAQEALREVREDEREDLDASLEQLFRALVHVSADGKAVRRRASRDQLTAAPGLVPRLVETLVRGGLLVVEGGESRATIALTHGVLIDRWSALREWLERSRARMRALQGLRKMLAAALAALADDHRSVRVRAAKALGRIGPAVAEAVPALIHALSDIDDDVRGAAAEALGRIGPAAAGTVLRADRGAVREPGAGVTGSVLATGENITATVTFSGSDAAERQRVLEALAAIDAGLARLSGSKAPVAKMLADAAVQAAKKDKPNKDEIGGFLDTALKTAREAAEPAELAAKLAPHVQTVAHWLGGQWASLMTLLT
jgi:hypothetical protein